MPDKIPMNIYVLVIGLIFSLLMSMCEAAMIQVPSDYLNIQDALNAASDGDTVKVSSGVYYENIVWPSTDGIQLLGNGEDTVINGGQISHVIEISKNSIGVITNKTLLSQFKITNGKHYDGRGGGIYCKNVSPCISHLVIEGNLANSYGGGFFAINSNVELSNSVVKYNYVNSNLSGGAGISIMYSNLKLNNIVVQENTSADYGGGIFCSDSELNATNILIVKNFSKNSGGGIYSMESNINLTNATIHSNSTNANQGVNAGGVFLITTHANIVNSIIWDNSDYDMIFYCTSDGYSMDIEYSNIKGGKNSIGIPQEYFRSKIRWLEGNLTVNPSFVDPDSDDYHLSIDSQCIDAGHPDLDNDYITWQNDVDDQDKNGTRMDMGYMYFASTVTVYSISGRVTTNGLGFPNVKISFLNQHVFTDSEGQFIINNIFNHSEGKVTPFKEGYSFLPPFIKLTKIESNRYADFVDAGNSSVAINSVSLKDAIYVLKTVSGMSKSKKETITNFLGMKFVWVPEGTFMMGSTGDYKDVAGNKEILHKVTLSKGFYIQTTEVTQGQWKYIKGNNPTYFSTCGDNCPVSNVSWNDAQEFIEILNSKKDDKKYRLPTEAEWEYAARAGTTTSFSNEKPVDFNSEFDSNLDQIAWYHGNSNITTYPVAQKDPNNWGLYDMHGNVQEWCQDWYSPYSEEHIIDPVIKEPMALFPAKMLRGGSWNSPALYCRSASRYFYLPDSPGESFGFRLVLENSR